VESRMRWIKKIIIILSCLILAVPLGLIIFILSLMFSNFRNVINFEDRIAKENDNVLAANVLYDADDFFLHPKLAILITFKDGQWIVLTNIRTTKVDDITDFAVECINGYDIYTFERIIDWEGNVSYRQIYNILYTMGLRDNFNGLIQNFDRLASYLDSLEEIDAEHRWDYEWLWSGEANLEKYKTGGGNERIQYKTPELDREKEPVTYSYYNDSALDLESAKLFKERKEKWRRILRRN
jgi:hypothetical protein